MEELSSLYLEMIGHLSSGVSIFFLSFRGVGPYYRFHLGIAQPNEGKLDLTLESPEIKRMRARCNRFVPGLSKAELDPVSPLVQGLRPVRGENVRVERELRRKDDGSLSRIIHSYGQGGSGFTLSFWCAGDVISLVEEVAAGVAPTPMKSGN